MQVLNSDGALPQNKYERKLVFALVFSLGVFAGVAVFGGVEVATTHSFVRSHALRACIP